MLVLPLSSMYCFCGRAAPEIWTAKHFVLGAFGISPRRPDDIFNEVKRVQESFSSFSKALAVHSYYNKNKNGTVIFIAQS